MLHDAVRRRERVSRGTLLIVHFADAASVLLAAFAMGYVVALVLGFE
jgi:hypothetical protein